MAETLNDSVGKDPLQDVFIAKTLSKKITAESTVVSVVNNEDLAVINKQHQNGKKSENQSFDNGVVKQLDLDGIDEINEQHVHILNQDCVKWNNNGENTGLSLSHFCDSYIISEETVNNISDKNTLHSSSESANDKNTHQANSETSIKNEEQTINTKGKKGISFPKDTFISGYFEPPDPWKDASPWTTEELISAYKKSCELHGTKPVGKIIQQLQVISSSGKREDLFSLKGEKLDQKQCECIEEIFRRVQFKTLDLEASHLDDECATALFDMIEYYETACQLNISFNKNIQARGWQACSRLVRRTPNLTYLDIRNCDLNERFVPIFGRALKLGCHLTILHMECLALSGRPLVILVAALKANETLQELFLADNKLMPTDGVQLGNLLRYNHKLSLLDLRNNHLQDVGTSHLCDGLLEQNLGKGLHTLVLWNNQINYQAMSALGRALASSECLETLNIGHNAITNEGVHLLKDGLLKTNSLLRLGLQGTKISDEGAVALAEYIADSNILLRIDLRENDIKTGGLMALSHAMRVNTSVTRIDLDKEPKKESGIKDYADQQSRLLRDILTFQQRNIQSTIEKEEQERKKLEEKAEAAKNVVLLENVQEIVDNAINESFTVIEEEALDASEEKFKKDIENFKLKDEAVHNFSEPLVEAVEVIEETAAKISTVEKPHHRPSQLFPYKHLHPQETLDSPIPTTNENPLIAVMTTPPVVPQTSPQLYRAENNLLSSIVSASPPEMILSPQYFPKQIARKIFSVSRVDEDPSWSKLSTSPTPSPMAGFDPLNISPVPLVSTLSLSSARSFESTTSHSPVIVPQMTQGAPQHSTNISQPQLSSPHSSELQSFSEQLLVASDMAHSGCGSPHLLPCDTNDDETNVPWSHTYINDCDKPELNSAEVTTDNISLTTDNKIESKAERVVKDGSSLHVSLHVNNGSESALVESLYNSNDSSDKTPDYMQKDFSNVLLKDIPENDSNPESVSLVSSLIDNLSEFKTESSVQQNVLDRLDPVTSAITQQAAHLHRGAGDVVQLKDGQESISPQTIVPLSTNTGGENSQSPAHLTTPSDLTLIQNDSENVNSSNSIQPLHISGPLLQLSNGESSCLSELASSQLQDEEISLLETFPAMQLSPEAVQENIICDSLDNDIETVDYSSIDEEPWLAVGVETESDLDRSSNSAKQPDFFTTLSSNGFTQELASALNNLDGSNGYYEEENNFDLQTPDEFERELDSMLAVVHGDLPWSLKDS
ncbi:protein phosphatase 1 regulatory subunit 37 [Biomphalaria glabrata]|nr:protein phosphatase 1 regulatory subunit 37 [Biomphalaria glabrata]